MLHSYYQFPDQYSLLSRIMRPKPSPRQFYDYTVKECLKRISRGESEKSQYNQLISESNWLDEKKVYYNVHPRMIEILGALQLPNLPANMIRFPHKAFVVQFPQDEPSLKIDGTRCLKSAICCFVESVLDPEDILNATDPESMKIDNLYKRLMIYFDFNEKDDDGYPLYTYKLLVWDDNDTLQQAFEKLIDDKETVNRGGGKIPDEFILLGTRIVLSVGFLAQEKNPLIQPHYLTADLPKLLGATEDQKKLLVERATHRRHDQVGYIVGDDRYIPIGKRLGDIQSVGPHESSGRQLKYQHIVGIHWKTIRFGPKLEKSEPRLILPYRRGEGLPYRD